MLFQAAAQWMKSDHWVSFTWNIPPALNVLKSGHIVLRQGHVHIEENEAQVVLLGVQDSISLSN